jgi:hypothetical protein
MNLQPSMPLFGSLADGAHALLVAAASARGCLIKSILDFTGPPELAEEVLAHYRLYFAYSADEIAGLRAS